MSSATTTNTSATTSGRAWASLVLGVLIFLVPFVTGSTSAAGYRNYAYASYLVGVAVVVLGAISIWATRNNMRALAWLEGVNALLGVWTIVAPFVLASTRTAMYANVVLGVVLVIVAGWDSYVGMTTEKGGMTRRGRVA